MTQVLAHPCSRAIVRTNEGSKEHRRSTKAQTNLIKQTDREERNTASAEQTVRRFFYGRGFGVSTLLSSHSLLHKYISGQHCTHMRNQPQSNINIKIHILDYLFGSPNIKVNIRFSCKQAARSAHETSYQAYI